MDTLPTLDGVADETGDGPSGPYAQALHPRAGMCIAERYELIEPLGRGATGWVWKARHTVIGKTLAIKLLSPRSGGAFEPEAAARMLREARTLSRIDHPGVIAVTDFGYIDGTTPYIVMELLRGESLRDVLGRGPVPWKQAWIWMLQLLDGLEAAHRHGVIHRDIKPANLFVTDRRIKLLDFGLAAPSRRQGPRTRITAVGEVFGTPMTMSPEQASGAPLDARSDLYSLGCVLYELIAGEPPLNGDPAELLYKHMFVKPPLLRSRAGPEVPDHVCEVIDRCLSKVPARRPSCAAEARKELIERASVSSLKVAPLATPPIITLSCKPVRRARWTTMGLVAAAILLIPPIVMAAVMMLGGPSQTFRPVQLEVPTVDAAVVAAPPLHAELPSFEHASAKFSVDEVPEVPEPAKAEPRSKKKKRRRSKRRQDARPTWGPAPDDDVEDIKNPFAGRRGRK